MMNSTGVSILWLLVLLPFFSYAQDETLSAPGACGGVGNAGIWEVPCGVTSITVQLYGGGGGAGGGGGGSAGGICPTRGGGGAGGGGYTSITFNVIPGSTFTYTVGSGGCGGNNGGDSSNGGHGNAGVASNFAGTDAGGVAVNLVANGGARGDRGNTCSIWGNGNPGTGGAGGTASGGTTNLTGTNGSNGAGATGGLGGTGAGPEGGTGGATNGAAGTAFGGGGAGGGNSAGGAGSAGAILITYNGPISVQPGPAVLSSSPTCTMDGSSAIEAYDPGGTYAFTPAGPTAGAGGLISGMVTGTQYTVTSGSGGCVSEPSDPFSNAAASGQLDAPVITSVPPTCTQAGSSAISNYSPLLTYAFTPAGPTVAMMDGTINGMTVGTSYTVQASEGPSCVSPQSAVFSNAPQLAPPDIIITGDLTHCPGGTTTITANGGVSYQWDDPAASTTASISVGTGTFTVTGTDASGCTGAASATVTESAPFTVTFTGDLSHCPGGTATVTANGGTSYVWSSGENTATVTLTEGTYTVSATDADGCAGSGEVTITEVDAPVANFTVVNACAGEPVQFTDATTVSAGSLTGWSWTFGDGGVSTTQNPTRTYQNPGTYNVTLVASAGSCTDEVTLQATAYPNPTAAFTTANVCLGEDAVFTDNSSVTGSVIAQWAWEFGDNQVALTQLPSHEYLQAGSYTVTLAVVTADMCTDVTTGNITVYPAPAPAFTAPAVCFGQPTVFTNASTVSSGVISSNAWGFGDESGTSSSQSPSYTYADDGSFPVTLEVTTSFGCVREVTQDVTVRPLPVIEAGHDNILCANQTNGRAYAQASGSSAPYEYQWNDPLQQTTPVIDNLGPGPYTVTVTDGQGCVSDTTVIVLQPLPLQVTVITGNDTCGLGNGAVQAVPQGGTPPFIYEWSAIRDSSFLFSEINPHSGWNTMLDPGEYSVLLTDSGGCTAQGAASVGQIPRPEAAFITRSRPEELKDPSVDFFNESVNAYSYEWHFGDENMSNVTHPDHDYERSGVYLVMLIAKNEPRYGCADTVYKYVEVEPLFTFYVPNAFSPDGDGLNDTWGPQGANYEIESYNAQVYDRWGKLIWQTDNPEVWWDGTLKNEGGDVLPQGVYTYRIIVKYFSKFEPRVITGSVKLYKSR